MHGLPRHAEHPRDAWHAVLVDEALDILLRAWTGEPIVHAGRFHRVEGARLNVLPVQRPRPPVWVATLRTDGGARIAARGLPAMFIPYASAETLDEMAAGLRDYRAAFAAAGGDPAEATAPFGFHVYCAESTVEARAEARPFMERYVRTRLYAVQRPFETLVAQDVIAIGDPDEILRVAGRYEAAGFTHLLAIANFGGLPPKRVLRSMELMARHGSLESTRATALAHAARQLLRQRLDGVRESDPGAGLDGELAPLPPGKTSRQAEGDIVEHVEPRKKARLLEHHADPGGRPGKLFAVEPDAAGRGPLEASEQPQERALAAARGPDHHTDPAPRKDEVDIFEGNLPIVVPLGDLDEFEHPLTLRA